MKKMLGILAVLCMGIDVSAMKVELNTRSFSPDSEKPIFCKITNNGTTKNRYVLSVFQITEDGTRIDASDDFNLILNDISISPQCTEEIKIVPSLEEEESARFEIHVRNERTGETKVIPLNAISADHKIPDLVGIKRNSAGFLKAVVDNKK